MKLQNIFFSGVVEKLELTLVNCREKNAQIFITFFLKSHILFPPFLTSQHDADFHIHKKKSLKTFSFMIIFTFRLSFWEDPKRRVRHTVCFWEIKRHNQKPKLIRFYGIKHNWKLVSRFGLHYLMDIRHQYQLQKTISNIHRGKLSKKNRWNVEQLWTNERRITWRGLISSFISCIS